MYQKYQIEDGKLDCEYDYKCPIKYDFPQKSPAAREQKYSKEKCQQIPLHAWKKPRYSDTTTIREDYTVANITTGEENGNSCSFFECPQHYIYSLWLNYF